MIIRKHIFIGSFIHEQDNPQSMQKKRVLILAEDNYEDLELWYPKIRLIEAGADVLVAGIGKKVYIGKHGYPVEVSGHIKEYNPADFDCVIIPGGWAPDHLRKSLLVLSFVKSMNESGKIVASICHGGWVPVSAGIVKGRKMTCADAIKDDVVNAGAVYLNEPVVRDGNLITSRNPNDLPYFSREIIGALEVMT